MKLNPVVTALSAAVVLWSATAQSAPTYSAITLDPLGADFNIPSKINGSGQIVINTYTNKFGSHIYGTLLYSGGVMTDLGNLGGSSYSRAYGINDNGQVVGESSRADGTTHAFLYSGGAMTDLGTLGGSSSLARDINDRGQIVGHSSIADGTNHAFLYDNRAMTDLAPLGENHSGAIGINASGQIVGTYSVPAGGTVGGTYIRSFLYSGGTMTDLGTLGGPNSEATGINDNGQIVGSSSLADGTWHAFLYSGGTMTDLGTLGGSNSRAFGINNHGQVVGESDGGLGSRSGFLYSGDTMIDLNSLIDPLAGIIYSANDINDSGQIAAEGCSTGCFRTLLLSPVPEPEIYIMMLAGLGLIGGMARRQKSMLQRGKAHSA